MNRNGAPAIILIYLIATVPVLFKDYKSNCQLAAATPLSVPVHLYSNFRDRLNATSELAEVQFNTALSKTVNKIFDLAAQILEEQLQQEGEKSGEQVVQEQEKVMKQARQPEQEQNSTDTFMSKSKSSDENSWPTSAHIILASIGNLLGRTNQTRKTRKTSHQSYYHPHKTKESPLGERMEGDRHENSRSSPEGGEVASLLPALPFPMSGGEGGEKWELTPVESIQSIVDKQRFANVVEENDYDEEWNGMEWKRSPDNEVSFNVGNVVQVSGDDDGAEWHEKPGEGIVQCPIPSDEWQRRLKYNDKKTGLQTAGFPSNLYGQLSEVVIESKEKPDLANDMQQWEEAEGDGDKYELRLKTRSVDAFPEIFTKPLGETGSSIETSVSSTGLSEALRTANNILSNVSPVRDHTAIISPAMGQATNGGNVVNRMSKEVPDMSTLLSQTQNSVAQSTAKTGEQNANLTSVMEKVLGELQSLKECKDAEDHAPDVLVIDSNSSLKKKWTNCSTSPKTTANSLPCDLIGSWNSEAIGLQFRISLADSSPSASRAFIEGRKLDIEILERLPPRKHDLMDCEWVLKGTMLKQFGGPFYLTAHRADKHIVSTFAGLCKVCGGIPTIFGSWTFVFPAKDCQDISMSIDNRRDVMRKNNLETKRKHRMDSGSGKSRCAAYPCR